MRGVAFAAFIVAGCGSDADVSRLPPLPHPPVVPPLDEVPVTGESRAFELEYGGGGSGAPFGTNLFVPPGASGSVAIVAFEGGPAGGGGKGARFTVPVAGDSVFCTVSVRILGPVVVSGRSRVTELALGPEAWSGVDVELRARDENGAVVAAPGARFTTLSHARAASDWEDWSVPYTPPAGAVKGEVCVRFLGATGTIEVDRLQVLAEGVPLPAEAPRIALHWSLDEPGDRAPPTAPDTPTDVPPRGFDFLIPPGTRGATLTWGRYDGALAARMLVEQPGNALICSQPFVVAPGLVIRGRVKVRGIATDEREWTGFVAEMRGYDIVGGLVAAGPTAFTLLHAFKAAGDWEAFDAVYTPPVSAVTGKVCFRFVESTGDALVDEAGVGE